MNLDSSLLYAVKAVVDARESIEIGDNHSYSNSRERDEIHMNSLEHLITNVQIDPANIEERHLLQYATGLLTEIHTKKTN
ncbi:hypothetical protein [Aquibacillus rhizosphaerae]|uniref:Uncharacterized protein n=1 Tax=Aquibacillus rhizosphaerae TaxID=3051431 RepID=A0ABT7L5K2_9BACI|nr:hypothetical protein [Aquibacillus sp. LR5S19]MDL4841134.1 hypothetical protein [Aquibacillus sp. LR5S19]